MMSKHEEAKGKNYIVSGLIKIGAW